MIFSYAQGGGGRLRWKGFVWNPIRQTILHNRAIGTASYGISRAGQYVYENY